jgi:Fic family protein
MRYRIDKPDLSGIPDNRLFELLVQYQSERGELSKLYEETLEPEYQYWDSVRFKTGLPESVRKEEFWQLVKLIRKTQSLETAIRDESGPRYTWIRLPGLERFVHEIDLNMGGNLFSFSTDIDDASKYRFISRGIMEEAIASSQLEGAHTTREAAKEMLREGRQPRDNSERMIVNGYQTMKAIESTYKDRKMSLETIFELHSMLTKDTLAPEKQGRFRREDEHIVVGDDIGTIYHVPPKRGFLDAEMARLVEFANDELGGPFLHPVIKAVMLHFWMGYLHPFVDGNGRLARALFYWYLLRKNYWAFAYLPISKMIKKSQTQYGMAYIYSEQDDFDLTYFIDYNLRKIRLAIKDFEQYLKAKAKDNAAMSKLSKGRYRFNDRQIQLLQYFHKNREERASVMSHMNVNQISRGTAIADLKRLEETGFARAAKTGRIIYYYATDKIDRLFET